MIIEDWEQITNNHLVLWIMHRLADAFQDHAILKGGMQLALLNSHRATNDLDYVFVPFRSKKDVNQEIERVLLEIPNAEVQSTMHSTAGRYRIRVGSAVTQIEFDVALEMKSTTLTTQLLAKQLSTLPKVVRVMSPDVSFAHKLAAWNERRLTRDLYDCYYFYGVLEIMPDMDVLQHRLAHTRSRIPRLQRVRSSTLAQLCAEIRAELERLGEKDFLAELLPLFPQNELDGLFPVFQAKMRELLLKLEQMDL